jgi:serine phosphatase RsbU (regulator of sigma subunit)
MERLREAVANARFKDASELCSGVLTAVQEFTENKPGQNDVTTLALMRSAANARAAALP